MSYLREREWCLVLQLLLLPLITGFQDYSLPDVVASTGSNTTLHGLKKQPAVYKRLTWLYTSKQKILECEYNKSAKIYNSRFKSRIKFDSISGALHIYDVSREDQGVYYMRLLTEIEEEYRTFLTVFDPVSTPSIKIEKAEKDLADSCHMKLLCEVEDQNVNYTWYGDSGPLPQDGPGDVLEITTAPQNRSAFYTCQVRNPASNKNDTVYFIPPCSLARSSGVLWIASWLVLLVPIVHAILLT
ncbi:CD48 antigen [Sigmodon hispidus]